MMHVYLSILLKLVVYTEFISAPGYSRQIEEFLEQQKFKGHKLEWRIQRGWITDWYTVKGNPLDVGTVNRYMENVRNEFNSKYGSNRK